MEVHERHTEPWRVTLVDTGDTTQTGGRLKRVKSHLQGETEFCFTYGDGIGDVDIGAAIDFHRRQGTLATVTSAVPPARFGALEIENDRVTGFNEKPIGADGMINAGFFVLSPKVIDLVEGDHTPWESTPLQTLARQKQLSVWSHHGFWQPMDTLRDKNQLEDIWNSGKAPWKTW